LMSVGVITLGVAWFLHLLADRVEGRKDWSRLLTFRNSPSAVRFTAIYLIFLISLGWTEDLGYGLKDLKTKLPIFLLPVFLSGMDPVGPKGVRAIWTAFIASLAVATTICLMVYFDAYNQWAVPLGFRAHQVNGFRDASIFISHIRFSLMLIMGIVVLYTSSVFRDRLWWLRVLLSAYFLFFLWLMESVTAVAVLGSLLLALALRSVMQLSRMWIRIALLVGAIGGTLLVTAWLYVEYSRQFTAPPVGVATLELTTAQGETYEHHPDHPQVENGHRVMMYLARTELEEAWEARSELPFDSVDRRGQPMSSTLIRYLTSLGLRKDAEGVAALTDTDVRRIEQGVANAMVDGHQGIRRRIDKIMFELHSFTIGSDPNGHSVFQRLEFWRAGWGIIREHPWKGVGVGDTRVAFAKQYDAMHSRLAPQNRLRAHNQWLTVWITSGILGLIAFVVLWTSPFRRNIASHTDLFKGFFIIATVSFFTEDTLESQSGVTFVAFMAALILFLPKTRGAAVPPSLDQ